MLHLPETAHLYVLLNCAQYEQEIYLEPDLESYLIQTMMRYSVMTELDNFSDIYQEEAVTECIENNQDEYLKEIADYCLMCTGLMPDRFAYEQNSFERLQEVGQSAFNMLSNQNNKDNDIYKKLSAHFPELIKILNYSQIIVSKEQEESCSVSGAFVENKLALLHEELSVDDNEPDIKSEKYIH